MEIVLRKSILQTILAYVQQARPLEACGLLAGEDNIVSHIYLIDNIKQSPIAYEMDPLQQLQAMLQAEEEGLELMAVFHSHPRGPETPSQTDVEKAYYPDLAQIIIALNDPENPSTRAFTIIDREITELPLQIIDDGM
jgi:proteasome lid subunit RPN8/RPN11